jgi:acyl-CoA synthetase (AMP-forming)/AMP-acid ligase II
MKHHKVYRTELTPVSFLERSAYVFPDKVAVIHGARRSTYAQVAERVNRLASALRAAGMGKHDRVAFLCPNIPAMLEAHYGVPAAGGVLVAINIRLSTDDRLHPPALRLEVPVRGRRVRGSGEAARSLRPPRDPRGRHRRGR